MSKYDDLRILSIVPVANYADNKLSKYETAHTGGLLECRRFYTRELGTGPIGHIKLAPSDFTTSNYVTIFIWSVSYHSEM